MSTTDTKYRAVDHSKPNTTVKGRLLEYSFSRFQKTLNVDTVEHIMTKDQLYISKTVLHQRIRL